MEKNHCLQHLNSSCIFSHAGTCPSMNENALYNISFSNAIFTLYVLSLLLLSSCCRQSTQKGFRFTLPHLPVFPSQACFLVSSRSSINCALYLWSNDSDNKNNEQSLLLYFFLVFHCVKSRAVDNTENGANHQHYDIGISQIAHFFTFPKM